MMHGYWRLVEIGGELIVLFCVICHTLTLGVRLLWNVSLIRQCIQSFIPKCPLVELVLLSLYQNDGPQSFNKEDSGNFLEKYLQPIPHRSGGNPHLTITVTF